MTCGMTVAPTIPTAISSASPSNFGEKSWSAITLGSGVTRSSSNAKATTITPTKTAITASRRRKPVACSARIAKAQQDRDHRAPPERDPEQQAEPERRAEHLGEVGRHRDHLGLEPEPEGDPAREVVAADLREVAAGRDPELRRERLHDHRHQVRGEHRPEQQIAVLRAGGDVGREVAGIEVGDRGDEGGPEERPERPRPGPVAVERLLCGLEGRRLTGQHPADQIAFARPPRGELSHGGVCTRIARDSTAPST